MKPNALGGLQYEGDSGDAARRADLITLPQGLVGTNCGNCVFFTNGFCKHKAVQLPVTARMCCKFWKNTAQINSWE